MKKEAPKFSVEYSEKQYQSITKGRVRFVTKVEALHGTSEKAVFKVYDHITKALCDEALQSEISRLVDKELNAYVEQVILDEF